MEDVLGRLEAIVGPRHVRPGSSEPEELTHDEALTARAVVPLAVVHPERTSEVAAVLRLANHLGIGVVARGSGTGLSGGAVPVEHGLVVAFDRMASILEVDRANQVAVVQPGVTLAQLNSALAPLGLIYPVSPGEPSASIGGNVATNAGGMRAVRYGVTRRHVLGLEAVLADGRILRTGGRFVKSSTGYDLTQLLVGSEGTLALITEITLRLSVRPPFGATVLAPYRALREIGEAVPEVLGTGIEPVIVEYLDAITMQAITDAAGVQLGVPDHVADAADCYLLVVLEGFSEIRLAEDVDAVCGQLADLGALDCFVLGDRQGEELVHARERAFFVAKAAGADDIVDTVVPRAGIVEYLATATRLADAHGSLVTGCGHVGDGNVHLSVFQPDPDRRHALVRALLEAAVAAGGAVSGEHGIGTEKREHFAELASPHTLEVMTQIKAVLDPSGILAPGNLLEPLHGR